MINMTALPQDALNQILVDARTRNGWVEEELPEALMREVYDLTKWGPTSANCSPARFVFVGSKAGKARLMPFIGAGNKDKTQSAPWTVIVATDPKYYDKIPELFPHNPGAASWFSGAPDGGEEAGFRNGTLQGAYLMIAARALGLDCGPMSGFDAAGLDQEFFGETGWKSNFLVNLGHGTDKDLFPRLPRLSFEDACAIV
jgi:3-hydroxypropanoate dehydrogenase